MESYSERAHQESIKTRLRIRRGGFIPFDPVENETISRMFDLRLKSYPQKPAIVSGGRSLTYEGLSQLSCDIGCIVGRAMGGDRRPIAMLISQHTNFVASVLGTLRCGGFYMPLDPSFPENRNSLILRESKAQIILTERENEQLAERLALPEQTVIYVDEIEPGQGELSDRSNPDDLAYVVFTSGSTGRPKGVMQTHRNVLQVVKRYTNSLYLSPHDRVSLLSSCSVTASIAPLLSSLLNGATLSAFSVRAEGLGALADWIDAERITLYHSTPSLFRHLMKSVSQERVFSSIQVVRLGGDSVYKSDWELFTQHCSADSVLVNSYGSSEMSSVVRFYMDAASRLTDHIVPVGYPLDGVGISMMGEDGLVDFDSHCGELARSPSAMGEIILKSRYLSPGYWNDLAATDAAFSSLVDGSGTRSYRTGDVGVIRESQGLVHLGRADTQTKLSGFRVEIAEVEACLQGCLGVKEAAVIVHTPDHGERELVGFVKMDSGDFPHRLDVGRYVQDRLPAHMVPSQIVAVEEIPFTPNGKIDRVALIRLREDVWNRRARGIPRTPTEEALREIWRQELSLDQVGMEDNFFELGGNSLLGMKLVARVAEAFTVQLRVLAVFQYPTIRQFAQLVDRSVSSSQKQSGSNHLEFEEGII